MFYALKMVLGKITQNISRNKFYIIRFYLSFKMLLPVILFAILKIDYFICVFIQNRFM